MVTCFVLACTDLRREDEVTGVGGWPWFDPTSAEVEHTKGARRGIDV